MHFCSPFSNLASPFHYFPSSVYWCLYTLRFRHHTRFTDTLLSLATTCFLLLALEARSLSQETQPSLQDIYSSSFQTSRHIPRSKDSARLERYTMRPCCNWLLALHCSLIPAFALNQAHSTEVRDRSLAQIDALVARDPTLIFNIPEAVIEDEDDDLFAKDALSSSPKASEQDYSTGFKKSYRWDGRNAEKIQEELYGVRLKQAKREQVSARIVKQRDMGLNAHPSPSPSPRPSLETITTCEFPEIVRRVVPTKLT